jgi:hypothetical protein
MSVSSEVQRTLVKSPPELWTELSDPTTLARHLGELGEIRIIGTEPERLVVWEAAAAGDGAEANGRVEIEPSGWGTRVTLSASRSVAALEPAEIGPAREHEPEPEMVEATPETPTEVELAEEPAAGTSAEPTADPQIVTAIVEPEPEPALAGEPEPSQGFFARLFRRRRRRRDGQPRIELEPELVTAPEPESTAEPEPPAAVEIVAPAPDESAPREPALAQATPEEPAQAEESIPEPDISAELAELEEQTTAVLTGVLDRLGAAHHRPFSRA